MSLSRKFKRDPNVYITPFLSKFLISLTGKKGVLTDSTTIHRDKEHHTSDFIALRDRMVQAVQDAGLLRENEFEARSTVGRNGVFSFTINPKLWPEFGTEPNLKCLDQRIEHAKHYFLQPDVPLENKIERSTGSEIILISSSPNQNRVEEWTTLKSASPRWNPNGDMVVALRSFMGATNLLKSESLGGIGIYKSDTCFLCPGKKPDVSGVGYAPMSEGKSIELRGHKGKNTDSVINETAEEAQIREGEFLDLCESVGENLLHAGIFADPSEFFIEVNKDEEGAIISATIVPNLPANIQKEELASRLNKANEFGRCETRLGYDSSGRSMMVLGERQQHDYSHTGDSTPAP